MTCGFTGVFGASIIVAADAGQAGVLVWNEAPTPVLVFLVPAVSIVLLVAGLVSGPRTAFSGFGGILRLSGRLPSDFMTMVSVGASLLNAGLMGLLLWGYVLLVGGDLNGPVLGGSLRQSDSPPSASTRETDGP